MLAGDYELQEKADPSTALRSGRDDIGLYGIASVH